MKKMAGVICAAVSLSCVADEGMWQPHQLKSIAPQLQEAGLKLDPADMANLSSFPMNTIISLGGCSASFVSPKGLVVTNHHCAYGSIQYNSSEEKNYLAEGYVAPQLGDELPAAPGSRVYVTESLTDVTDKVSGPIPKTLSGKDYYEAIEANEKALVAECEKNDDYRCDVYSFYGGQSYFLIKALAIRDVRLVYAPPSSIGLFGGDTDNWMWPRHTGDWAFYRAYVGPDGRPADFSEENVPYASDSFLKINASGVQEDDFVMVLGYPGRTNRYRLASEVVNQFEWVYPTSKRYREEYIDVIKAVAPAGSDERIKYQNTIAGLANYAKNFGSMIESYRKGDMLQRKQTLESELQAWLASDETLQEQYGSALGELTSLITQTQENQERDLLMRYMGRTNMWRVAKRLYRLAHEKQKPDAERKRAFQERSRKRFKQRMQAVSRRYSSDVDQAILLHFIKEYVTLPVHQRVPEFDAFLGLTDITADSFDETKVKAKLAQMHADTKLGDKAVRLAWMDKSVAEFKASDDPYIQFAVSLYEWNMAKEAKEEAVTGELKRVRPQYMQAIIDFKKNRQEPVYADANRSLRISYGTVKGYSPQDGLVATPFTTMEGMLAKYVPGDEEFDLPDNLREAIIKKAYGNYKDANLDSIQVNYLSNLDITGGNSGSPTLNAKGEFVGLAFDGVYESIIGDWDYNPDLNRTIHASSPYMLWVMENIDGAENLIKEMTIVP